MASDLPLISAKEINQRIHILFEQPAPSTTCTADRRKKKKKRGTVHPQPPQQQQQQLAVVPRACLLARIVAMYSLLMEQQQTQDPTVSLGRQSRRSSRSQTLSTVSYVLPLLRALVQAEVISLMDPTLEPMPLASPYVVVPQRPVVKIQASPQVRTTLWKATTSRESNTTTKKVHFAAHDGSSLHPPIDRIHGSDLHSQQTIQAYVQVQHVLEQWEDVNNYPQLDQVVTCLRQLVFYLKASKDAEADDSKPSLVSEEQWKECAASIGFDFDKRRLTSAQAFYHDQLAIVLDRLVARKMRRSNSSTGGVSTVPREYNECFLMVEHRLAEQAGQAIRYNLRMLLNDKPPRLSPNDELYDEWSKHYPTLSEHVKLVLTEGAENSAVDDACFSALVSIALQHLHEFLGMELLLDASSDAVQKVLELIPTLFFAKPASNRDIDEPLDEMEIREVIDDIGQARDFLSAVRSCRFLLDLLSNKGVQAEVQRHGGWSQIETYASLCWKYRLNRICPADAHLVALSNVEALKTRLQQFVALLEANATACRDRWVDVEDRFVPVFESIKYKKGKKTLDEKSLIASLEDIARAWQEAKEVVESIPAVLPQDE